MNGSQRSPFAGATHGPERGRFSVLVALALALAVTTVPAHPPLCAAAEPAAPPQPVAQEQAGEPATGGLAVVGQVGGATDAVAVDPADASRVYVGTGYRLAALDASGPAKP